MTERVRTLETPKLLNLHLPKSLQAILPGVVVNRLRGLRVRLLSRSLPGHMVFEQSSADAQASESMSLVVPVHDAPAVTRRCLSSLERYAPRSEVILVDDRSVLPETLETIQEFRVRNGWRVIRHGEALGHSRACEAGARLATRSYLCFLNSDTVVTPWCWRILRETFETDPRIGAAGPSTSCAPAQTIPLAGYCRDYWNDSQICAFAARLVADPSNPPLVDLSWVSGFALFVRRILWEELGGFDRSLPDYGNEVEFCERVAKAGYRIVWVRRSYIHHFGQQSYEGTIGETGIAARISTARQYIAKKHAAGESS